MSDSVVNNLKTIRDYLRWATSRFNKAELFYGHGTDNAWDDAFHLISYALSIPIESYDILEARLTIEERQNIVQLIDERINTRKPVPYITHRAWFAGIDFYVDERVLVPRSPISELIENQFEPWIGDTPSRILDLCTGSGCIGIACALAFPDAIVDAVDYDENALEVAKINVARYELEDQVNVIHSDLFTQLNDQKSDIIVTNPPYVSNEEISQLPKEFQHEPKMGLYGYGADGLDIVQKILKNAPKHLNPQGILICEVGMSEAQLIERYPTVPFTWIEFQLGGQGVFVLTREQLQQYQDSW